MDLERAAPVLRKRPRSATAAVGALLRSGAILGFIDVALGSVERCDVATVEGAAAQPGWGPALYDLGIEAAQRFYGRPLAPDRRSITTAATSIWERYLEARPDVESSPLPRGCPTYTDREALNRAYQPRSGFRPHLREGHEQLMHAYVPDRAGIDHALLLAAGDRFFRETYKRARGELEILRPKAQLNWGELLAAGAAMAVGVLATGVILANPRN